MSQRHSFSHSKSSRYASGHYDDISERDKQAVERMSAALWINPRLEKALAERNPLLLEGVELGATITALEPDYRAKFKSDQKPHESAYKLVLRGGIPTITLAGYPLSYFFPEKKEATEGASRTAPTSANVPLVSQNTDEKLGGEMIAVDPELVRLSIARHEFSAIRLWYMAQQVDKDGSGRVNKAALWECVRRSGIISSKRTFNDILRRGRGLYWQIYTGEESVFISLTGWRRLAEIFTERELGEQSERVETDQPGAWRVYLDLSGDLEDAQARVYAAWMAQHTAKFGFMRISRARLQQLWGRSTRQLIRWEQATGIRPEACYAEHADIHNPLIPGHAYLCLEEDGKTVFASWRTSNRYKTPPIVPQEHPHSGQRRKVRAAVNRRIDKSEPVYFNADGRKTGRIHFFDQQRGRRWQFGYKVLRRHLKKHEDVFDRRHYVYITKRHGKHIEELSTGDVLRHRSDRRDYAGEQSPDFKARAAFFKEGWIDRNA